MIPIITLNAVGCIVSVHDILSGDPAPLLDGAIQMRPDWPALGTPEFDEKLRTWHERHNQDGETEEKMSGYDVLYCGKCGAELPEVTTVYRGGPKDDEREVEKLACKHQGDGGVTFKYFDWDGKKYVAA